MAHRPVFLLAIALFALATANLGDGAQFPRHIVLLNDPIDTAAAPALQVEHLAARAINSNRPEQYLLHMPGPVTDEAKARVSELIAPAKLGQYMPHNTFLVVATPDIMTRVAMANHPDVLWVGDYPVSNRVSPNLAAGVRAFKAAHLEEKQQTETEAGAIPVKLVVAFPPDESRTQEEAEAMAAHLTAAVAALPDTKVTFVSSRRVVVTTTDDTEAVAALLARQPEVHWVEARAVFTSNNYWANALLQGGTQPTSAGAPATFPFHAMGLDGTGQIVGIGDSGLDISHCFFNDPNVALPVTTVNAVPITNIVTNQNHRKVVQYIAYVDSTDSSVASGGGHGSHVCGTVAGNSNVATGDSTKDNGIGKGAKIAFFDMSPTPVGSNTASGAIYTPDDMVRDFFPPSYSAGARIHSNSWGSSPVDAQTGQVNPNYYTSNDQDFDTYIYSKKDFIVLVAAGNDGDSGPSTIGSPAVAKNVISVGAGSTTNAGWVAAYCCLTDGTKPCIATQQCSTNTRTVLTTTGQTFGENGLAFFSSTGPISVDNRIKPDIAAPGFQTLSTNSNGASTTAQCASTNPSDYMAYKSGTSMATPTTSGFTSIIRQYLTEGWYPTGAKVATNAITPSASLMKAMVINGAVKMTGNINDGSGAVGTPLPTTSPNFATGFGRISLPGSLYIASDTTEQAKLKIFLDANKADLAVSTGQTVTACAPTTAVNGVIGPMKWTLVWSDPPASTGAGVALINNLDMVVYDQAAPTAKIYPNGATTADSVNNVEQAIFAAPTAGSTICAQVTGTAVPQGPQTFSLVVSGPVDPTATTTTTGTPTTGATTATATGTGATATGTATGTSATGATGTATATGTGATATATGTGAPTTAPAGTTDASTTADPNAIVSGGSNANGGSNGSSSSGTTVTYVGIAVGGLVVIIVLIGVLAYFALRNKTRAAAGGAPQYNNQNVNTQNNYVPPQQPEPYRAAPAAPQGARPAPAQPGRPMQTGAPQQRPPVAPRPGPRPGAAAPQQSRY